VGAWDNYTNRLNAKGGSVRGARLQRERGYLNRKLPSSLSYHTAIVDGAERNLAIINSDNLNLKTVCAMPGEDIQSGSLVEWNDNRWLVFEEDVNGEVYKKAKMMQCNFLLRWVSADGEIHEQWCVIEDGTKYMAGITISSYNDNGMSLGDTRISMTIARNQYTVAFNRDDRFLIDDYGSPTVLAYRLTKPFKLGGVYNGHGVMSFVLSEDNTTDDDSIELHIADYYKHFPKEGYTNATPAGDGGGGSWL
jgi:hypothetical protein